MNSGGSVAPATSLVLVLCGLLACACSSGGPSLGAGGSGGAATGTRFGAVIVLAPGLATGTGAYYASAGFSDAPHLLPAGELTSLRFGIGEPDGCAKTTTGGCRVFRCPQLIAATSGASMEPNVGALTITWPAPSPSEAGSGLPPSITFGPDSYDLFYWGTATPVSSLRFSAAGATIPAFPPTDVDAPQLLELTQVAGSPLAASPPILSRANDLFVTWSGGTGDAVFALQQTDFATSRDTMAVCRVAAAAGSFTIPSGVLAQFQAGDASLAASAVSAQSVAAGDYATTLAIAAPTVFSFPLTLE